MGAKTSGTRGMSKSNFLLLSAYSILIVQIPKVFDWQFSSKLFLYNAAVESFCLNPSVFPPLPRITKH